MGEVGLIQRLRKQLGPGANASSVLVGIGDDTAVLCWTKKEHLLFASDMLVEDVHFRREQVRPRWIGWKALARNVSDVAAMGGVPRHAVVSLGLPPRTSARFADEVYAGLSRCARRFGVAIVGGDTVRAPVVVVDVAILGTVRPAHLVLRSGARVGDAVFVTGRLGGSLSCGRHATFLPRLAQAQWLVQHLAVHAMMDLSDGLASDLWQMSRASRVTFRIREAEIPVSRAGRICLRRNCSCRAWRGRQATWHALMDGEDFELLFVVPSRAAHRVPRMIGRVPVTKIGMVTKRGAGVLLSREDGRMTPLIPEGFRHF